MCLCTIIISLIVFVYVCFMLISIVMCSYLGDASLVESLSAAAAALLVMDN